MHDGVGRPITEVEVFLQSGHVRTRLLYAVLEGRREGGRKEEGEMCSVDKNGQNARQGMIGVCLCEVQYSTIQYSRLICVLLHWIAWSLVVRLLVDGSSSLYELHETFRDGREGKGADG